MSLLPRLVSAPLIEKMTPVFPSAETTAGGQRVVVLIPRLQKFVVAAADRPEKPERIRRLLHDQVDAAANRITVHVGRDRLGDLDRLQQLGRDNVERNLAKQRIGRRDALAVDHHGIEPRLGAADDDVAALALILGNRDARHALGCFGRVAIRKRPDAIGRNHVGDVGRGLLTIQGPLFGVPDERCLHADRLLETEQLHAHVDATDRRRVHCHVDELLGSTDVGDDDLLIAGWHTGQAEDAGGIRGSRVGAAHNGHACPRQGLTGRVVHDAAFDDANGR
jgi:hypothetical protein